ncbi:MAG: DUF1211 domain-containing protein, partial [Pedobacter sp.]
MTKTRLEAFSDGVIAILITIMVLELKIPHDTNWAAVKPLIPILGSYILSFILLGIYWGNHHHLLHTAKRVTPGIIWANMHLLFWLSLLPFCTGWMGVNKFENKTVAVYGAVLVLCGPQISVRQGSVALVVAATPELMEIVGAVGGFISIVIVDKEVTKEELDHLAK